jgi:hypothetical protein
LQVRITQTANRIPDPKSRPQGFRGRIGKMIRLKYQGSLGNKLWQYAVARTIAEREGRKLVAKPIEGFPRTFEKVSGSSNLLTLKREKFSGHLLPEVFPKGSVTLEGYFQRAEYIENSAAKSWCRTNHVPSHLPGEEDLVVPIRRGWNGYPIELCPSIEFYTNLIRSLNLTRTWVLTDSPDDPWFEPILSAGLPVQVVKGDPLEQFSFIQSATRVVMSPSTFAWWASYAGDATVIYWPQIPGLAPVDGGLDWFPTWDERFVKVG